MAASTTHYLPFTRFTRQVVTDDMAVLSTGAAALHAEDLLKAAPWMEAADTEGKSTFPARNALQTGFNALWDAFKFCGDYASGYQKAYAGMVAYRFKIPEDALAGPTHITSIDLPLYVDRWLVDGVRVAAYLSNDAVPPADWTTCREGTVHAAAELPMEYTEADPPVRIVVEKNKTLTVTFAADTDSLAYLYVILSLEDYTTVRGFWIEGAALIVGDRALTTFAAAIEPDASTAWDGEVWCNGRYSTSSNAFADASWQVKRVSYAANSSSVMAGFPSVGSMTEVAYDGETGIPVGLATAGETTGWFRCMGAILARYVGCGISSAFTKIRFSNAAFAPMAGKNIYLKMCVFSGPANLDESAVFSRPKASTDGYINPLLWQGAASVSVTPMLIDVDKTPWALTKIGDVILGMKNYTDASTFPVVLPSGGTRVIIITFMPVVYWGTIGADTTVTLKPGANIILS